jgi:hypothetical protein
MQPNPVGKVTDFIYMLHEINFMIKKWVEKRREEKAEWSCGVHEQTIHLSKSVN